MSSASIAVDRIEVSVSGLFMTHHHFDTGSGSCGELTVPSFGRGAAFCAADGQEFAIRRTSWLGGKYEMSVAEEVRATARPRGAFRRAIEVDFPSDSFAVVPAGAFRQGWYLLDAQGIRLLEFQPRGAFRRGAHLEVLAPTRLEVIALFYYLVYQRKQEEAAAASAAASSA